MQSGRGLPEQQKPPQKPPQKLLLKLPQKLPKGAGGGSSSGVIPRPTFRGVAKTPGRGGWTARLTHNGEKIYIGMFLTAEEAAHAYDKKAFELKGR